MKQAWAMEHDVHLILKLQHNSLGKFTFPHTLALQKTIIINTW
jgi:hypothetical protein